jgi:cap2 methyltransferase
MPADRYLLVDGVEGFPMQCTYHSQKNRPESDQTPPTPTGEWYTTENNIHIGQRKLLMSEIHFLTEVHRYDEWDHQPMLCVYAGACPGTHIRELARMFPNVYFLLVDPAFEDVHARKLKHPRITVCSNVFTMDTVNAIKAWMAEAQVRGYPEGRHWVYTALAALCGGRRFPIVRENLLFISDIRQSPYDEVNIAREMKDQESWFTRLGAYGGLLKFRLPFPTPTEHREPVESLEGDLCLPIWGPQSTTECRLVVWKDAQTCKYDPVVHERIMAGFNSTERNKEYTHGGFRYGSYDEYAEQVVLDNYERRYNCPL